MTKDKSGQPGRAVNGRLGRAVQGRLASRGLTPYDVQEGAVHAGKNVYRIVAGATREPGLGAVLAICRTTQTDPTTLLEMAGLWPPDAPGAPEADALDHALLTAQQGLEALSPEHKHWALAVVLALLASAPSVQAPVATGHGDASSSQDGQTSCVIAENVLR